MDRDEKDLLPQEATPPEKDKKKKKIRKILLIILLVLLVLLLALAVVVATLPRAVIEDNIQQEEELQEEEVDVTPDLPPVQEVRNIALFGIDQEEGSVGRSDAVLIVTIDKANNKIKMTSLDRDSLVAIDGHGEEKLTHAWAYGHGKLAVKTLNQNFGMNITDYAYVNFSEFVDAIDYLGGVRVDLTSAELERLNEGRANWISRYGRDVPKVPGTGMQKLNGAQALSYARDRADGTANRGGRQREVLLAMYEQVRQQPLSKLPGIITRMLRLCHTTMSADEITDIAYWALTSTPTFESLSLPNSQLKPWGGVIDRERGWVRVYDLDAAADLLHNFIYETDKDITGVTEYIPEGATTTTTTTKKKTTTTTAASQ